MPTLMGPSPSPHEELIMLAYVGDQQVQPAEARRNVGGAKSPDDDKIVAMQAELTLSRYNSNWLPTSRRLREPRMTTRKEARSKVEEITRIRSTRRTTLPY